MLPTSELGLEADLRRVRKGVVALLWRRLSGPRNGIVPGVRARTSPSGMCATSAAVPDLSMTCRLQMRMTRSVEDPRPWDLRDFKRKMKPGTVST